MAIEGASRISDASRRARRGRTEINMRGYDLFWYCTNGRSNVVFDFCGRLHTIQRSIGDQAVGKARPGLSERSLVRSDRSVGSAPSSSPPAAPPALAYCAPEVESKGSGTRGSASSLCPA